MKKIGFIVAMLMIGAAPARAQLPEDLAGWAEGPVSFLMTPAETQEWAQVSSVDQARNFIELFWAKRDPNLETRVNEFRELFEARVEAADEEFGEENTRGAMTDRGKTLILMGTPKEHARGDIGEYLSRIYRTGRPPKASSADPDAHIQMQGISFNLNKNMADIWGYAKDQIPESIEWPSREDVISFAFFDTEGDGHFKLQLGIRKSALSVGVLRKMPVALLLHPELKKVPSYGLIPGLPPASASELQALEEGDGVIEGAKLFSSIGAAGPASPVNWILYSTPAGSPIADVVVGRLSHDQGDVGSFHVAAKPLMSSGHRFYELAIPAAVGGELQIGLFKGGRSIDSRKVELAPTKSGDGFLSAVFSGAEVSQPADAQAGDPFVFGGYHLLPRLSGNYRSSEGLALFALLSLPDGTATRRPGTIQMRWYVDGKPEGLQPTRPVQFAPAGPGLWVWGTQLPLSSLSPGHEYQLKVRLRDQRSKLSTSAEIPVHLTH